MENWVHKQGYRLYIYSLNRYEGSAHRLHLVVELKWQSVKWAEILALFRLGCTSHWILVRPYSCYVLMLLISKMKQPKSWHKSFPNQGIKALIPTSYICDQRSWNFSAELKNRFHSWRETLPFIKELIKVCKIQWLWGEECALETRLWGIQIHFTSIWR